MDPSSPDYLLQTLTNVYTDPDPRTYPLSSYVYMIEPTGGPESHRTIPVRAAGSASRSPTSSTTQSVKARARSAPIGYSPLPVNLVEAAFGQIQKLQQADPRVDLTNLNITPATNRPLFRASRTPIT